MAPELGCLAFGPYLVEKEIGSGGMGIVYRARHETTGQPVALKSVRLRSSELLTSFRREVHALAMVRHPGIVRIIDHGVTEKNPWYAMELIDGQSLSQHLAQLRSGTWPRPGTISASSAANERSRLMGDVEHWWEMPSPSSRRAAVSPGDCVPVLRGICRTLSFLHGRGLVHRDLKPDNILIRDGTAVLVDFGLVVQFSGAVGREVLELADVAGTFAYMAPEQRFGRFVDARADLFSLGCVMYEWLTGLLPFGAGGLGTPMARRPLSPSELNADVSPALDALVMRLITKDPTDRLGYADDVDAVLAELEGSAPNEPGPRTFYLYRSALAGRKQVLPRLEQALDDALTGRSRVSLVTGESGSGKTRLVVELAARAADRGMQVVPGECVPVAAGAGEVGGWLGAPLHAFRQFLHAVVDTCRAGGSAKARQLLGERAALLVAYEPSLAEFVDDAGPGPLKALPAQTARARLFECLKQLIVDYARAGPALLVLDDLQWADDLSLEFLSHLVETTAATDAPFVLVGTCRLEEMGERLRALAENPAVSVESLPLFDHAAVREMVSGMLALHEPPPSLVDFVDEESRGNPFFIAEYLRAAIEAGLLRRDAMGRWHLSPGVTEVGELRQQIAAPPTISAVVALRLRELEPASIDILRAAAVLGREFDVDLVARTAGLAPAAVLDAYAALRPRNILEEDGSGVSRFAHDKLREITYAETDAEQRVELHARAAAALEERYATRDAAPHFGELGFHHARAGARGRAADYYQRAGEQAQEAYANEDAIRFFRLALEQTEDTADPLDDGLRTRLREQIGDGLIVVGRAAEAGQIFEIGMDSLPNAFERHDRARWRRKLAQTWERQHRHIEALETYALAEDELGVAPDQPGVEKQWWHEFVQLQVDRAWSLYFLARVDELTALVERVRPAVLAHASPIQLAKFLEWQVLGAAKRDRLRISDETLEHTRILLEAGEACGEVRGVANARFMRGFVFLMRGDVEEAEPFFVNAIEAAERLGDALLRTRFISYYAIVLRRLARLTEARATAEGLLTFAQERSMFDYVGVARATLAWCAWRDGQYYDVERHADEALAAWDRLRPAYIYPLQWLALMPLAARWQRAGRTTEALGHWRRLLEDPQQRLAPSLEAVIEAALLRGDAPSAAAVVDEAIRQRYL